MDTLMKYVERIHRCGIIYMGNELEADGLGPVQYKYIVRICASPGKSQDELAKELYVNKSNVARQLTLLEQNGYVRRQPCQEDRRQTLVHPTDKAIDVLPRIQQVRRVWNERLLEGIPEETRREIISAMEGIAARAQELADGSVERDRDI